MSLPTTQSLFQYAIASLGQAFSPACPIQNTSDFVVWYTSTLGVDTLLSLNVDYFVTGVAANGVITAPTVTLEGTGAHYAIGGTLTIQRKPPLTQPTTYLDGVRYLAAVQNNSLDWLAYGLQELADIVGRCLQVPPTSVAQSPIALAVRKGMLAGWDANGNFAAIANNGAIALWPTFLFPSAETFLPGITSHTGGGLTALDGLNVIGIAFVVSVVISLSDNREVWKLRPAVGGDPSISDGVTTVVPVVNPSNLRWIRIS